MLGDKCLTESRGRRSTRKEELEKKEKRGKASILELSITKKELKK